MLNTVLAGGVAAALPLIAGLGNLFVGTQLQWMFPCSAAVLFLVCLWLLPKVDVPPLLGGALGTLVGLLLFLQITQMAGALAGMPGETLYRALGLLVFLAGLWWAPRTIR